MKTIKIIGAFDRYNYGDLLFPIILSEKLKEKFKEKLDFKYYALRNTNLAHIGAIPTSALSEMKIEDNDVYIIAGGEVAGAKTGLMYMHLSKNKIENLVKKFERKILKDQFDVFAQNRLKINSIFPWLLNFEKKQNCFIYNTIGTNSLDGLNKEETKYIIDNYKNADYISVRDCKSKMLININEDKIKVYPDSATSMSEIFDSEYLNIKSSEKIKKIIANDKYICFQINIEYLKECNILDIVEQLNKIESMGYKIVLVPIGFAYLHEDYSALKQIKKLNRNFILLKNVNIYEIMNVIANATFFAGTSLHGNITAMAFGVRHIGINPQITKLSEYLKNWEIENQNKCIDIKYLYDNFNVIMKIEDDKIEKNKQKLLKLSNENYQNIYKCIMEKYNGK